MGAFVPRPGFAAELRRSAGVQKACKSAAEDVATRARDIAPVSDDPSDPTPGSFRDSIHAEDSDEGARVVADDPAAVYIEFGTAKDPPHGTLRQALEASGLKTQD